MTGLAAGGGIVPPTGELATVLGTDVTPIGGLPVLLGAEVIDGNGAGETIGALEGPLGVWEAGVGTNVMVLGTLVMMPGLFET